MANPELNNNQTRFFFLLQVPIRFRCNHMVNYHLVHYCAQQFCFSKQCSHILRHPPTVLIAGVLSISVMHFSDSFFIVIKKCFQFLSCNFSKRHDTTPYRRTKRTSCHIKYLIFISIDISWLSRMEFIVLKTVLAFPIRHLISCALSLLHL